MCWSRALISSVIPADFSSAIVSMNVFFHFQLLLFLLGKTFKKKPVKKGGFILKSDIKLFFLSDILLTLLDLRLFQLKKEKNTQLIIAQCCLHSRYFHFMFFFLTKTHVVDI